MRIRGIQKGIDFERYVLGFSSEDVQKQVEENIQPCNSNDLQNCIARVKEMQLLIFKWDPKKPRTHASRMLFEHVADRIGKERKHLRLYAAVGTPLDYKFGIDCFFELEAKIVTLDLTISKGKLKQKAHVLVRFHDLKGDRYDRPAQKIAKLLKAA